MRVLVACEFSGVVRRAFTDRGHEAWSCDLLPADDLSPSHFVGDVRALLKDEWDLMIAHPPCTHLAVSGARWFKDKREEQEEALAFVRTLLEAPIPRIALENPVSVISSRIRKPDQIIQPWQFGHGETKKTCLWLKNLPKLRPTNIVEGREARVHRMPPGPDRWKKRSITYQGVAEAMADQWTSPFPTHNRRTLMTDRDVVKEALGNAKVLKASSEEGCITYELMPEEEAIAAFLQHILEAGPDERMVESRVGIRVGPDRLMWNIDEQKRLLSHLIKRLQEQSE